MFTYYCEQCLSCRSVYNDYANFESCILFDLSTIKISKYCNMIFCIICFGFLFHVMKSFTSIFVINQAVDINVLSVHLCELHSVCSLSFFLELHQEAKKQVSFSVIQRFGLLVKCFSFVLLKDLLVNTAATRIAQKETLFRYAQACKSFKLTT